MNNNLTIKLVKMLNLFKVEWADDMCFGGKSHQIFREWYEAAKQQKKKS